MARAILTVAAVVWLAGAVGALVLAVTGIDWLLGLLPPLTIDADAVRGAIVTMAVAAALVGGAHGLVLLGLRSGRRWGSTLAILLVATLTVLLFALGVAAVTSVAADASTAAWLLPAAGGAGVAAVAYALALVRLVADRRSASVPSGAPR